METTTQPQGVPTHWSETQTSSGAGHHPTAASDDDIILLRRVAAQDQQAFDLLYARYAPRLAGFLANRLSPPEQVDDVLHEVMLAFWRQVDRFDPARRLSTWLLGMARHKAISAMRTAKPKPTPVPVAEADPLSPEMVLYSHERARTVVQAIATLPPEQRLVIEMTYYQDCSPQDIAARTGVLVNTVRSRLRLAHRRLAVILVAFQEPAPNRRKERQCLPLCGA